MNAVAYQYLTILSLSGPAKQLILLSILGDALLKEIIQSSYIHVDETGLAVLLGKESTKERKYMPDIFGAITTAFKN